MCLTRALSSNVPTGTLESLDSNVLQLARPETATAKRVKLRPQSRPRPSRPPLPQVPPRARELLPPHRPGGLRTLPLGRRRAGPVYRQLSPSVPHPGRLHLGPLGSPGNPRTGAAQSLGCRRARLTQAPGSHLNDSGAVLSVPGTVTATQPCPRPTVTSP